MFRYGQNITWGTLSAPHPFSGICTAYSYRMQSQRQFDADEVGDNRALILHSRKAAVSFEAKVVVGTGGSSNFLDLSSGAAVSLSSAVPSSPAPTSNTVVLASRCTERWQLGQPKTISMQGTHYPDLLQNSPVTAGTGVDVQADDQSRLAGIISPGGKLIYGTANLSQGSGSASSGIVHMLEITQELTLTDDEPAPTGVILGCTAHGYLRTIKLDLLAQNDPPDATQALVINGAASSMSSNYRIESIEQRWADKRGKMYSIGAVWIPPLG